jgi:predicted MFS family arabinose efflux permease
MGVFGGILLGQLAGGLLARAWGVTGPFWFGFAGSAVVLALIWRQFTHVAHAGEEPEGAISATGAVAPS